jgi:tetratricopeptide (TPR) repeat protein
MFAKKTSTALVSLVFSLLTATAAYAIGSNAGDSDMTTMKPAEPVPKSSPKVKSAKKLKCNKGETAKRATRQGKLEYTCVKLKADVSPDLELYQQARLLADEGEYEWALDHLRLIQNQNDPEVLSYTGYTNRKAGRLETGIAYYQQALTINPNYVQAREYLGEAYTLVGFNDLAKQQLDEIRARGGASTEAYLALEKFMRESRTN